MEVERVPCSADYQEVAQDTKRRSNIENSRNVAFLPCFTRRGRRARRCVHCTLRLPVIIWCLAERCDEENRYSQDKSFGGTRERSSRCGVSWYTGQLGQDSRLFRIPQDYGFRSTNPTRVGHAAHLSWTNTLLVNFFLARYKVWIVPPSWSIDKETESRCDASHNERVRHSYAKANNCYSR